MVRRTGEEVQRKRWSDPTSIPMGPRLKWGTLFVMQLQNTGILALPE